MIDAMESTAPKGADGLGEPANDTDGELISRLRLIEQQPLEERAAAFAALHDAMSSTLDTDRTVSSRPHG